MSQPVIIGNATLYHGDMREVLPQFAPASIDSIVTDPPYGLGFMGRSWDKTSVELQPATWAALLRVAKPGAHLIAFGGTRTFHRIWCAIEDAGWEIRDTLMWLYGSGMPKSKNQTGDWQGWGTGLKPAYEPIVLARKPFRSTVAQNLAAHGTGALNIDGCRVATSESTRRARTDRDFGLVNDDGWKPKPGINGSDAGRWPANVLHDGSDEVVAAFPESPGQLADASSSSSRKTQHVYGAMKRGNGRDGEASADSENTGAVGFKMRPGARRRDSGSAARFFWCPKASRKDRNEGLEGMEKRPLLWSSGEQSPGTFQSEGTDKSSENNHPTVKPTALMRYVCKLVTPPGGVILDPFVGSGSTGKAAVLDGFGFIGIDDTEEHVEIARRRITHAVGELFA